MNKTREFVIEFSWLVLLAITLTILSAPYFLKDETTISVDKDPLIEKIEQAEGKPVIVSTEKFGDDKSPNFVRTYCQALPFKRHIGDDQIYCWTERLK